MGYEDESSYEDQKPMGVNYQSNPSGNINLGIPPDNIIFDPLNQYSWQQKENKPLSSPSPPPMSEDPTAKHPVDISDFPSPIKQNLENSNQEEIPIQSANIGAIFANMVSPDPPDEDPMKYATPDIDFGVLKEGVDYDLILHSRKQWMYVIAKKYGISPNILYQWNDLAYTNATNLPDRTPILIKPIHELPPSALKFQQKFTNQGGVITTGNPEKTEGRNWYLSKNENTWEQDKDEKFGKNITYDSKKDAETRLEYLQSLGKWENYEIKEIENNGKKEFYVVMQGKRTINNFIELVRKAEAAYPNFSTDEIIDGIRGLAPGYNNDRWRLMLGKSARATAITPVKDKLTQEDIDALKAMIEHGGDNEDDEKGIAKDNGGDYVAMGHVLTGITAGINRNKETDLTSGFLESAAGFVGVGEYVDNLYASTIAGDLGQSATIINNQKGVTSKTNMIGDGTEATTAELFGDVDGFNIGHEETDKKKHESLSNLLQAYYASIEKDEKKNRFQYFKDNGKDSLKDQTTRFAKNYTYKINGKRGGLFSEIGTEVGYAVNQFNEWMSEQMKSPSKSPTFKKQNGKLIKATGILLVSDPSNYKSTKKATLDGGVEFKILDNGTEKSFNSDVVDKKTYGWTKIMVMEGENQGKIGWVSNKFIQ